MKITANQTCNSDEPMDNGDPDEQRIYHKRCNALTERVFEQDKQNKTLMVQSQLHQLVLIVQ